MPFEVKVTGELVTRALWKIIASVLVVNGDGLVRTKVMPINKIRWRTTHGKERGGNRKTATSLSLLCSSPLVWSLMLEQVWRPNLEVAGYWAHTE